MHVVSSVFMICRPVCASRRHRQTFPSRFLVLAFVCMETFPFKVKRMLVSVKKIVNGIFWSRDKIAAIVCFSGVERAARSTVQVAAKISI
jgi:hypothetical protein